MRKNNGILVIFSMLILCVIMAFSSCKDNINNTTAPMEGQSNSAIEAKMFSYQLKDDYSSREEIKIERELIRNAYSVFLGSEERKLLTDEQIEKSHNVYKDVLNTLNRIQDEKFPLSEDEKRENIKSSFYYAIEMHKQTIDYYFTEYPSETPDSPRYLAYKQIYEISQKYKEKYESGELTIEEAYSKMSVERQQVIFPPQETATFDYKNYQTTKMP